MSGPSVHHLLENYVYRLYYCENDAEIEKICKTMKSTIDDQSRLLPSLMFSNLISKLVESGMALINFDSRDSRFKIVGLLVLDSLLDVSDEIMAERRIEIANLLRKVLEYDKHGLDTYANVLRAASISIGHLARVASTTEIEFLQDFFVTNAIKWLSDTRSETRRYAGALLISELAVNSPALIFVRRKEFFDKAIWEVIFDRAQSLREVAANALRTALTLVAQREQIDEYLRTCMEKISVGFTINSTEKVHGSLLIIDCLVTKTIINPGDFLSTLRITGSLSEFFWNVLQRKDSKDNLIKGKIIDIIPKLAELSPSTFLNSNKFTAPNTFLTFSVSYLLDMIMRFKDKDMRAIAFISLGKLFVAVSSLLSTNLTDVEENIFKAVSSGFREPFCVEALRCLGMVVKVSKNSKHHINQEFVTNMFNGGLTSDLINSLKEVNKYVAAVRNLVQTRLRIMITNILLSHSIVLEEPPAVGVGKHPMSPANNPKTPVRRNSTAPRNPSVSGDHGSNGSTSSGASTSSFSLRDFLFNSSGTQESITGLHIRQRVFGNGLQTHSDIATDEELILALKVLASFDFVSSKKHLQLKVGGTSADMSLLTKSTRDDARSRGECSMLLRVVREGVVRYLDDSNPNIRDAAAVTCATVMDKVVKAVDPDQDMVECLLQIMNRLLMLGVGDDIASNRIHVFTSLTPSLDHVITASDNVDCLVDALNDESFDVRTAAMTVLSRVAHFDNVHVMPLVRLILSKLMQQLQDSMDHQMRLESVQLLQALAIGMDDLIIPYSPLLLPPLLQLLQEKNTAIKCGALATIGELAKTSPGDVRPHLDLIFPTTIELLNSDQIQYQHLEITMTTMCSIVSSLSLVSEPYSRFPALFGSLVRIIQKTDNASSNSRMLAISALGLIGVVGASRYHSALYSQDATTKTLDSMVVYDDDRKDARIKGQGDLSLVLGTKVQEDDDELISLDKYYVNVVIRALTNIIRDNSLATHHQTAMTVSMRIVKILGSQGINHLDDFVSAVVHRAYAAESISAQDIFLEHVTVLVNVFGVGIIRHLPIIVKLSCDNLGTHLQMSLDILESICTLTPPQHYNSALREVLPHLIQIIRAELIQDMLETMGIANTATSQQGISAGSNGGSSSSSVLVNGSQRNLPPSLVSADSFRKSLPQTRLILQSFSNLAPYLREYSQQLIPIIISVMEDKIVLPDVRREALCAAMHIVTDSKELKVFAGRLFQPILRIIDSDKPDLQASAFIALSTLLCKLQSAYLPFVVTAKRKISSVFPRDSSFKLVQMEEYEALINRLLNQLPLPSEPSDISLNFTKSNVRSKQRADSAKSLQQPITVDMKALKTAYELTGRTLTSSDLVEWMRRLSIELIRQSPSPIIRPCAVLAKVYQPLALELFNASFVSVWNNCFASSSSNDIIIDDIPIIHSFEIALESTQIPDIIRQSLLNLAEFLEMQDKSLLLPIQLLANQSHSANMFAKCLHYREIEFASKNITPSKDCIEALISVNQQLGLREAALGVLEIVKYRLADTVPIQPTWLEKLHNWQEARLLYLHRSQKLKQDGGSSTPTQNQEWLSNELGMLRCLRELGDNEELMQGALTLFSTLQSSDVMRNDTDDTLMETRLEVQRLGAHASWMLGQWDSMERFLGDSVAKNASAAISQRNKSNIDLENNTSFYHTIMAIHKQKYFKAMNLISETRKELGASIRSLLNESYSRAYRAMVSMQLLTELEEVVKFKEYAANAITADAKSLPSLDPSLGYVIDITEDLASELSAKKANLMQKWRARIKCAPREVDVYRQMLNVHSLLLEPEEDLDSWLEVVTMCHQNDMLTLCGNILRTLGAPLASSAATQISVESAAYNNAPHSRVMYHTYKFLWAKGERTRALSGLSEFLDSFPALPLDSEIRSMNVRCLLKKAEWTRILMDSSDAPDDGQLSNVLEMVRQARDLASDQYSVWHAWAVTNFDQLQVAESKLASLNATSVDSASASLKEKLRGLTVQDDQYERLKSSKKGGHRRTQSFSDSKELSAEEIYSTEKHCTTLIIEAIRGFVKSIMLSRDQPVANVLQDILRLLTLWFSFSTRKNVFAVLNSELENVPAESWLGVVPQLIARMHVRVPEIAGPLRKLLMKISAAHPQALVPPVSVALNTTDAQRKNLAVDVISAIRKSDPQLVEEATMVSKELMRVAISAHEFWHEGLERAAHMYIVEKDVHAMLTVLLQLHGQDSDAVKGSEAGFIPASPIFSSQGWRENGSKSVSSESTGAFTLLDLSFQNNFGRDLLNAYEWICKYKKCPSNLFLLHQAWSIYYDVFRRIAAQLKTLKHVELAHVSPALTAASGLCLAVPGTYKPLREVVRVTKFAASIDIISSKQRPRRMAITGSDGRKYRFLLKGHEDLRQDERVMQLFGLMNACLANNRATNRMELKIVRYSVLPLSNNSGLIGWVENCDTLNQLVKMYRESADIKLNVEHRMLMAKAPNFDKLPHIHKISAFKEVLDETQGVDIAKMLWLKSKTADLWIERRTNYTKSLALTSMAGYILGLGDRHPSNLMLDRVSGRIIHIDFGDCFEVAMSRSKFPETVPFRLTRMLVKAMEVSGIEGTYRQTCHKVMHILRENRDSVMAMLEAFVHDPLISWRLVASSGNTGTADLRQPTVDAASVDGKLGVIEVAENSITAIVTQLSQSLKENSEIMAVKSTEDGWGGPNISGNLDERKNTSDEIKDVKNSANELKQGAKFSKLKGIKDQEAAADLEHLNSRAMEVILRIQSKLTGRDFNKVGAGGDELSVDEQVERLIDQATSVENLCQLFVGWCPFW